MNFELSTHAKDVIIEREIDLDWISVVITNPAFKEADKDDSSLWHLYARIPEHGNRLLRVVLNTTIVPPRVVTAYFDRTKGKTV